MVAGTPEAFRRYVQQSRGELSCAKPSYVRRRGPVLRLLGSSARGELELNRHLSGQVQDSEEASCACGPRSARCQAPSSRHSTIASLSCNAHGGPAADCSGHAGRCTAGHTRCQGTSPSGTGESGAPRFGRWSDGVMTADAHPCRGTRAGTDRDRCRTAPSERTGRGWRGRYWPG